jgi:hypothetical protein
MGEEPLPRGFRPVGAEGPKLRGDVEGFGSECTFPPRFVKGAG